MSARLRSDGLSTSERERTITLEREVSPERIGVSSRFNPEAPLQVECGPEFPAQHHGALGKRLREHQHGAFYFAGFFQ